MPACAILDIRILPVAALVPAPYNPRRVLKPGGRGVIIDLRPDASREAITTYVDHLGLSWWSTWTTKLTFRFMLLKRAHSKAQLERFLADAGVRSFEIHEEPMGFEVWLRK